MLQNHPHRHSETIETGNWEIDNRTGREQANKFIEQARETGDIMPLTRAIEQMVKRGHYGPTEVGFISRLVSATL